MIRYNIESAFFVLSGKPIDGNNIINEIVPRLLNKDVYSNEEFILNPFEISQTPPKQKYEREFILILRSKNHILKPIRFKERFNKKSKDWSIKVRIPEYIWTYRGKTNDQLKSFWNEKNREQIIGFNDFVDFHGWYDETVRDKECYYCGLNERESQELIHYGLLTSNRFPIYGLTDRGINRGYWLEIDRRNPKGIYSRENCVPSCYFCNNDKSDVFFEEDYFKFKSHRLEFIKDILNKKPVIQSEDLDIVTNPSTL